MDTLKTQIVVEQQTKLIICTAYCKGKEHDFKLYKGSKINLATEIKLLGDKGYQGIKKIHNNSQIQIKSREKKIRKRAEKAKS